MFLAPSDYRTVRFNTERQYVLVPVEKDPKEEIVGLISDMKVFADLFDKVRKESLGEGEKQRAVISPFKQEYVDAANAYMGESRANEEYVWQSLVNPIMFNDAAYSRLPNAPEWHKDLMDKLAFLSMIVSTYRTPDQAHSDFRNMELSSRIILGNASVGPSMMYGRAFRMLSDYHAAIRNSYDPDFWNLFTTSAPMQDISNFGRSLACKCMGQLDWFDYAVQSWNQLSEGMPAYLETIKNDLDGMIEKMESGLAFATTKTLAPNLEHLVMYFSHKYR